MRKRDEKVAMKEAKKMVKVEKAAPKRSASKISEKKQKTDTKASTKPIVK